MSMTNEAYSILVETLINDYVKTFDLKAIYEVNDLDKETVDRLSIDEEFNIRIRRESYKAKVRLLDKLEALCDAEQTPQSSTRLRALELYGKIVYPDKFDDSAREKGNTSVPVINFYLPKNGRDEKEE